jgi:4-hydroxy-L-threonine phosphate dehydrogenase PdxA
MSIHGLSKPVIALAMGDPAGISPELTAKLVSLEEIRSRARLVVIGDRRVFDEGGTRRGRQAGPHDGDADRGSAVDRRRYRLYGSRSPRSRRH